MIGQWTLDITSYSKIPCTALTIIRQKFTGLPQQYHFFGTGVIAGLASQSRVYRKNCLMLDGCFIFIWHWQSSSGICGNGSGKKYYVYLYQWFCSNLCNVAWENGECFAPWKRSVILYWCLLMVKTLLLFSPLLYMSFFFFLPSLLFCMSTKTVILFCQMTCFVQCYIKK